MSVDYKIFDLGDHVLQSRMTLKDCKIAYKTYGTLNETKDNVIVYPTWYSGQHYENEWLIGDGMALDPVKYFIIVPNMIGNGLSSSPSNMPEPYNAVRFPKVTMYDNVRAQHRLVTELFGVETIKLVTGWSMGGGQTYHWGAMYPDMVERIAPFCGSAKCSRHNRVFLEGVKAALTADVAYDNGWYKEKPVVGLRAMGRVYAGWGFSQAFYRQRLDIEGMGYDSLEDFLVGFWENLFLNRDPNNLLTMLSTWQNADIGNNPEFGGDLKKALGAIKAKAYVMPASTDLYFPPEDNEFEVAHMPNAELVMFDTVWGHFAGGPNVSMDDVAFLDRKLKDLLAS